MHSEDNLPRLPLDLLYAEVARWVSTDSSTTIWPGECPLTSFDHVPRAPGFSEEALLVAELVSHGAAHHDAGHTNQAIRCWSEALRLLHKPGANRRITSDAMDFSIADWINIAQGNLEAVRRESFAPYSYPPELLARLLQQNILIDAEASPPTLVLPREVLATLPSLDEIIES